MPRQIEPLNIITRTLLMLCILYNLACPQVVADAADEQCYATMNQGRQALAENDMRRAMLLFQAAKQMQPSDARPYFWIAVCLDQSGDANGAVKAYADCIAAAKEHGMDSAELRIDLGNALCKLNYYKEAIYDYRRALQIDPNLNIAHLYLARALIEKGEWAKALSELDLCNNQPEVPFLRSLALKGEGNRPEALKEIRRYLASLQGNATNGPQADRAHQLENELARPIP